MRTDHASRRFSYARKADPCRGRMEPIQMKPYQLQNTRAKWHERASRFEINEIADIDRLIADLRQRRQKILNRIHMRTNVWVDHHQVAQAGVTLEPIASQPVPHLWLLFHFPARTGLTTNEPKFAGWKRSAMLPKTGPWSAATPMQAIRGASSTTGIKRGSSFTSRVSTDNTCWFGRASNAPRRLQTWL